MKKYNLFCINRNAVRKTIILFWVVFTIMSCKRDKESQQYEALVKQELSSGKRADSLFYGIYFGMTGKDFFAHCWKMNQQGLFFDGSNHNYVLYKLNHNELKSPASMNFRPEFHNEKIYKMQVSYQYDGWAPWNKKLFAEGLLPDIVNHIKSMYAGNSFIKMTDKKRGTIYIKVDGNRRITVGQFDDTFVKADFTDLTVEKQLKK